MKIDDILGPKEVNKSDRKMRRQVRRIQRTGDPDLEELQFLPMISWWEKFNQNQQQLILKWLIFDEEVPYIDEADGGEIIYKFYDILADTMPYDIAKDGDVDEWMYEYIWDELQSLKKQYDRQKRYEVP